jgi:RNA polymerase primary sigma factor
MQDLKTYFKGISKTPLLTAEQEVELSKRIEKGDKAARDKMIASNLKLVISTAKKYQNRGCYFEDLIQEGNIGLMKSVDKFDWRRGCRFSTYATWWIRQSIVRHLEDQSRTIRVPGHISSSYSKIQRAIREFRDEVNREPTIEEICEALGLTPDSVESVLQSMKFTLSLDALSSSSSDDERSLINKIEDEQIISPCRLVEDKELTSVIKESLSELTDREEKILRLRFGISEPDDDDENFPITVDELESLQERKTTNEY